MLSHQANHNHKEADDKGALPQLAGGEGNQMATGTQIMAEPTAGISDRNAISAPPENAAVQTGDPEGKATQRPPAPAPRRRLPFTVARATATGLANKCCFT